MKNFKIEVISKKPKKICGLLSHTGQITINDFQEKFTMPLIDWTVEDYQKQWEEGLERIKTHNQSCLVATVQNLKFNPHILLWTMYKEGNKIFFHNQLLISTIVEELQLPITLASFNSQNCCQFINPIIVNENNEGVDEEGTKLFEKSIDLESLKTIKINNQCDTDDSIGSERYKKGNLIIIADQDMHNNGRWKMFKVGQKEREGGYNEDLIKIGK